MKYGSFHKVHKKSKSKIRLTILLIVLLCGMIAFFPHFFRNTYVATISNKYIKQDGDKKSYVVYAQLDDGSVRTFKDVNSAVEFKFNSDEIYGGLQVYRKYNIKTYGFRIPIFSVYENILKVEKLKDNFTYPNDYPKSN